MLWTKILILETKCATGLPSYAWFKPSFGVVDVSKATALWTSVLFILPRCVVESASGVQTVQLYYMQTE